VQIFFTTKDIYSVYILDVLSILCRFKLKSSLRRFTSTATAAAPVEENHHDAGGEARQGIKRVHEQSDRGKGQEQGRTGRSRSKTWFVSLFTSSHSPHADQITFSLQLRPINKKLGIKVISDIDMLELFRGIRSQLTALLNGLDPKDLATMSLGLSHSLSRCVAVYQTLYEWSLELD
jgi:hypothetical protein